jgi:serine/threonine-protein kinase
VTHGEYLAFLQAMVDAGEPDVLERFAPFEGPEEVRLCTESEGALQYSPDNAGREVQPSSPVVRVNHRHAVAYLDWLGIRTKQRFELPHELQWEKAARGVDSRCFAWGNQFEAQWTCVLETQPDKPWLNSIDDFRFDASPYGIRGLTGNSRDWCSNTFSLDGDTHITPPPASLPKEELIVVRGGSWNSLQAYCRLAARFALRPNLSFSAGGFRWVYSLPKS